MLLVELKFFTLTLTKTGIMTITDKLNVIFNMTSVKLTITFSIIVLSALALINCTSVDTINGTWVGLTCKGQFETGCTGFRLDIKNDTVGKWYHGYRPELGSAIDSFTVRDIELKIDKFCFAFNTLEHKGGTRLMEFKLRFVSDDSSGWDENTSWGKISTKTFKKIIGADFDDDGTDELVGLNLYGKVKFTADNSDTWDENTTWTKVSTTKFKSLVSGDFNGDGKKDLAGITTSHHVRYNTETSNNWSVTTTWTQIDKP